MVAANAKKTNEIHKWELISTYLDVQMDAKSMITVSSQLILSQSLYS